MANDKASPAQIGRPVRIVSISFVEKGLAICFDANFPEVWQRPRPGASLWPGGTARLYRPQPPRD